MSSPPQGRPLGENPYVGPRPLKAGEPLFGRDSELRELFYRLNSDRVVLLHSPSGAGKSSLIAAGLIPRLKQEEFDVWPIIRVWENAPAGVNRYAYSTLLSLEDGLPDALKKDAAALGSLRLADYAATRPRRSGAPANVMLIFDQFEEVLTIDPVAIAAKREFFAQLGAMLRNRAYWALFVIREDYLAPLDPYASFLQFKNRFRLDLFSLYAATEAIEKTALPAGRVYAQGAAAQLVRDLATVDVQQPDGTFAKQTGSYVEPVQLQVVCKRLWDQMPESARTIDQDALDRFADVTHALGAYYESSVGSVASGDRNRERAIREWFSDRLIARGEIRGQVLKGEEQGLDTDLIDALEKTHLIRGEKRRGATWYELAHDRLINPVLVRNQAWFDKNLEDYQRAAALWEKSGRPDSLLLMGEDLKKAEVQAAQKSASLSAAEGRFLRDSHLKQEEAEKDLKQSQRVRRLAIISAVIGVIALVTAGFATQQSVQLRGQRAKLQDDAKQLNDEKDQLQQTVDSLRAAMFQTDLARRAESNARAVAQTAAVSAENAQKGRDQMFLDLLSKHVSFHVAEVVAEGGAPGPVKLLAKSQWTPVIGNPALPFAAARRPSDGVHGRIIAAGHDGLLNYGFPGNRSPDAGKTNVFLEVGLTWLQGDRSPVVLLDMAPKVAFMQNSAQATWLQAKLREWGFRILTTQDLSDREKLNQAAVIVLGNAWFLKPAEIDAVEDFVKQGGGLMIVGLGWSWQAYDLVERQGFKGRPTPASLDAYPMNQLLRRFGAEFGGEVLDRTKD